MAYRPLCIVALLTLFAAGCSPAPDEGQSAPSEAEAPDVDAPPPLPEHLDTQIREYLDQYGRNWPSFRFHGVVLVARGDTIAVDRAFGLADLPLQIPNETTTRFRIGTMSAQLTAAAIVLLADHGRLSLSDSIDTYVPGYPGGDKITIEQLLTHTSGIPNFTDSQWFQGAKAVPNPTARLIDAFRDAPLEHAPGTEITPSNSNYVVLAAIVERLTGTTFDTFIATNVLRPLSMTQTEFGTTEHQQAMGLQFNELEHLDPVRSVHPAAFGAAGGYISSARDLFRFNRGLATNALFSETARDQMMGLADSEVGFAWVTQRAMGHSVAGWPGLIDGLNCSVLNIVEDQTVIIVLANTEVVSAGQIAQDIMSMVYGGLAPEYDEHREVDEPLVAQVDAVGQYVISKKTEQLIEAVDPERLDNLAQIDVALVDGALVLVIPEHGQKRMHPLGDGKFFFKDLPRTTAQYVRRSDGGARLVLTQQGGGELVFLRKGGSSAPASAVASR